VAELGPTFGRRVLAPVEADHVVPRHALKFIATGHVDSTKLECTFHAWKREAFLMAIGTAILTVIRSIPGGILVFLPSYDLLDRCIQTWQSSGNAKKKRRGAVQRVSEINASAIWEQLIVEKETIVVEPSPRCSGDSAPNASAAYEEAKSQYERAIQRSGRGILLAVYRGRMSEGVSFDDDYARGVICVGIPFPNLKEERLVQKRACNDFWLAQRQNTVSGDLWYECRALQAVAQALGRCIRHPKDFGALVLLDSRWVELGKVSGLPHWLQRFFRDQTNVEEAAGTLRDHFRTCSQMKLTIAEDQKGTIAVMKEEYNEVGVKKEEDDMKSEVKSEDEKSDVKMDVKMEGEDEEDEAVTMPQVQQVSAPAVSNVQQKRSFEVFRQSLNGRKRSSPACIDLE